MSTFESTSLLQFASAARVSPPALPPIETSEADDLTGYEVFIDLIRRERLDRMAGDFLEIGCCLGGGTAKLAKLATSVDKQVWVIDPFDTNLSSEAGPTQEEIFRQVTAPWSASIQVLKQDSTRARLPDGLRFGFAFADGNRDPVRVKSDFQLVWRRLLPGGWAGFHDYGGDLPDVTAALDSMLEQYAAEIGRVEKIEDRWILLVQKRGEASGKDQSSS